MHLKYRDQCVDSVLLCPCQRAYDWQSVCICGGVQLTCKIMIPSFFRVGVVVFFLRYILIILQIYKGE